MNYHCKLELEEHRDVKPMKLVVQYLTQAAVTLPTARDDARSRVQHTLVRKIQCQY